MEDVKTPDLLPCPFCGERMEISEGLSQRSAKIYVHPRDEEKPCIAETFGIWDKSADRIAAWNRRAAPLPGGLDGAALLRDVLAFLEQVWLPEDAGLSDNDCHTLQMLGEQLPELIDRVAASLGSRPSSPVVTTEQSEGAVVALYVPVPVDIYGQGPASVADFHHNEHQIWDAETNGTLATAKDEAVARWLVGLINAQQAPTPASVSPGTEDGQ